jgi:hypothetical protein
MKNKKNNWVIEFFKELEKRVPTKDDENDCYHEMYYKKKNILVIRVIMRDRFPYDYDILKEDYKKKPKSVAREIAHDVLNWDKKREKKLKKRIKKQEKKNK